MAIVIKGLMPWGSNGHLNSNLSNFPVICDGYVKYGEAEADRFVAILKTNNCAVADRVEYSKQPTSARAA